MTIVKTLQQQQQTCQVAQVEIKQEVPKPPKRRKSIEKPVAPIPPPPEVHSSSKSIFVVFFCLSMCFILITIRSHSYRA